MTAKIRKVISQRYKLPKYRELILAGRFRLVILTEYTEKGLELERAVRVGHRGPVRVRVAVVPELGDLLTGG